MHDLSQNSVRRKCSHSGFLVGSICAIVDKSFDLRGLRMRSCNRKESRVQTRTSTSLESRQASRFRYGNQKDGYIETTHADGSSGIVVTTWGDAYRRRIIDRLNAGLRYDDTSHRSRYIAWSRIIRAGLVSGKRFYIGPTIVAKFSYPHLCLG